MMLELRKEQIIANSQYRLRKELIFEPYDVKKFTYKGSVASHYQENHQHNHRIGFVKGDHRRVDERHAGIRVS